MALLDGSPRPVSVTGSSVAKVGVATAVTAVCGYLVLYLAARDLDPAGFSVFAVFWGAFGLVSGAAFGLLQQTTREVRLAAASTSDTLPRTHPMRVAAAVGAAAAAALAGSAALWAPHVFTDARLLSVILLALGLAGVCLHATLLGSLAGVNQWSHYGALMATDAVLRVAVAVATVVVGWGLVGFLFATVAGAGSWLLMLALSPTARAAARLVARESPRSFLRGAAHAVAATGASAILVMGFPVLLQATSGGNLGAAGGVVILAVTLTRAPLLVPLTAMQGNMIAYFVDHGRELRALARPGALVAALGVVAVLLAGLVGPWLMQVGFGAAYTVDGSLLAWLTAGAVAIALLTVTGAAAVAAALHRAYSLGWVSATVMSALLLTLPLPLETRTVVALLCGPVVGIGVHVVALTYAAKGPPR
nr:hypothetical protein [Mycobacterium sp. MS1601]